MFDTKKGMADFLSKIARTLPKEKKQEMLDRFIEKHKDNPNLDELVVEFKRTISYEDTETKK